MVTAQTRTILGDYIAGIVPNPQGTANVTLTTTLAWVSGPYFTAYMIGAPIQVNGVANTVLAVNSPTSLTLANPAANAGPVPWVATIPTGEIFQDSQAYVVPTVNLGWRLMQDKLAEKGHPRLQNEIVLTAIPVVTNTDPVSQQWISWTNFFDGTNLLSPATNPAGPVLPQDFISPLKLFERVTGMVADFRTMHLAPDALYSVIKASFNRYWDWREDALYFPGSLLSMDLRIRYAAFLPDLVPAGGGFGATPVPIMRCVRALSYYTAAIFVTPRGSLLDPNFEAKGDAALDQMTKAWVKTQQRGSYHRQSWGGRGRRRGMFAGGVW